MLAFELQHHLSFSDLTALGRPIHQGYASCRAPPCHGARPEQVPCASMPRCQAGTGGVAYRQTPFQLGQSCGARGTITTHRICLHNIAQHFHRSSSMGATSGCPQTAWRSTESCKKTVRAAAHRRQHLLESGAAGESEVRSTQDPRC